MQTDPIIAVKNVRTSSNWYCSILGCRSMHGGNNFDILCNEAGEVQLCLHQWGEHDHPSMSDATIPAGNGLILYFRTAQMETLRDNALQAGWPLEEDIHHNPNSLQREFALRDPDGYYLIISEWHQYEG